MRMGEGYFAPLTMGKINEEGNIKVRGKKERRRELENLKIILITYGSTLLTEQFFYKHYFVT